MIRRLVRWTDRRLGVASFTSKTLHKAFPDHWSFMLGEVALYSFILLVVTGTFLALFFTPSTAPVIYDGPYEPLQGREVPAAYDSVMRLSFEVRAGLLMRQVHHWTSLVFVAAIVLHVVRVFFTGAFRAPRELTWVVGVLLLMVTLGAGFTGYSLPYNQLSGTGIRVAYAIFLSVPFVGPWLASAAFAGPFPSPGVVGRLFAFHVFIFPALIAILISVHLAQIWRQKHTQFAGPGRREDNVVGSPLWPRYAMKSVGLMLCVFGVCFMLGALFQIEPVWLQGPYDATTVAAPAQPDWYLGWVEGALRLMPGWNIEMFGRTVPEIFLPSVVMPLTFFAVMITWPFIEARATGDRAFHNLLDRPRDVPWRTGFGAGVLTFAIVLTIGGSNDVIAYTLDVPVEHVTAVLRGAVLLLPFIVGVGVARACRVISRRRS